MKFSKYYYTLSLTTEVHKAGYPVVKMFYNERGQRIKKESYNTASPFLIRSTDYYALDISGNAMAIYTKIAGGATVQNELPIYGLSRLGIFMKTTVPTNNYTNYQITDHLGNVRAIIKKIASSPIAAIYTYADYYPFGEKLPTRDNISGNYRYAFQGQEKDPETGMEAFELRLWDGRIGRWLSPDPKHQYASPYLGMGNNPLSLVDPDGGSTESTGVKLNADGSYTVVGARNDGDCGIYLVDANNNWNINTSQSIGFKTLNPFDFMIPNDQTGAFDQGFADVTFKIKNLADGNAIFETYTSQWSDMISGRGMPTAIVAMGLLAIESRNNAYYDIKSDYPQSTGGFYTPVLLGGNTITTVRALGNLIFGANMRTVYEKSWDTFLDTPKSFYKLNMPIVGWYNQHQNNGNGYNSGYPYYGEHTYSGTNIYNGYFRK